MINKYVAPEFEVDAFNCQHCETFSHQEWYDELHAYQTLTVGRGKVDRPGTVDLLSISFCNRCGYYALWLENKMLYPISSLAPLPIEDMPEDVKTDFKEARNIVNESTRGAAALLRLALQKLMPHLGEEGKNINTDIGNLVKKGLPLKIQQSLDSLRVIGNESVHPGELDLKDDFASAIALFKLLNLIVEVMIVQPKEIGELYEGLPESKKQGIENRDKLN